LNRHAKECDSCKNAIKTLEILKFELDNPESEEDVFPEEIRANAIDIIRRNAPVVEKQKPSWSYFLRPILLSSFALLTVLFISFFITKDKDVQKGVLISKTEMQAGEPVTITLEYTVNTDLKDVKVAVQLDDGIEFFTSKRKLLSKNSHTWSGDMKKGINKIPFVISVNKKGTMEINTKANYMGYSHPHKIVIKADDQKVTVAYYRLSDIKIL